MTRLASAVVAVLGGATIYNVALALGAGSGRVRHGHDPPGATVVAFAVVAAVVAALVISVAGVARPTRVAALFAPAFALVLLAGDFTYDPYYGSPLQRYWDGTDSHGHILAGVVLAFVAGAVAYVRPRAAAGTLVALPVVFLLTIAYLGH